MDVNTAMSTLADFIIILVTFAIIGSLAGQAIGAFILFIAKKVKQAWTAHKEKKKLPEEPTAE